MIEQEYLRNKIERTKAEIAHIEREIEIKVAERKASYPLAEYELSVQLEKLSDYKAALQRDLDRFSSELNNFNWEAINQFGVDFFKYLKNDYPAITADTQVLPVPPKTPITYTGSWYYMPPPKPQRVILDSNLEAMASFERSPQYEVKMQEYGDGKGNFIYLGYVPEIDTIFYSRYLGRD